MPSTVVGHFHVRLNAENAIRELERAGFPRSEISLVSSDQARAAETLIGMHVPEREAREYTRFIEQGTAVLVVRTGDHESAQRALAVFGEAAALHNLQRAISGPGPEPDEPPMIQAAHLRNGARHTAHARDQARIYDFEDLAADPDTLAEFDAEWRRSFEVTFRETGYRYPQLLPAYRYGAEIAVNQRFGRGAWREIERAVRRDWEQRNPHTWDQAGKAVRYAWHSVRARLDMAKSA